MNVTVTAGRLLTGKLVTAFFVGFLSYAIPRVLDALDAVNATGNYHVGRSVAISFLAGCVGAALRYAIAVLPLNFNPTDKLHTIGARRDLTVVASKTDDR